ncbi:MAG TPA: nucleotidyltransferase domain-containing protein [Phycisphaerales bacterium]|nr:nucleotidyltransferase domain-containing protein [Phycisphaerales bacterium]
MRSLKQANLSPAHFAAVTAAADLLRSQFGATSVILFGSVARGEAREDSDVDLLVLLPREVTFVERFAISGALSPLGRAHDVLFNTVVAEEAAWPSRPFPLSEHVRRDGIAA